MAEPKLTKRQRLHAEVLGALLAGASEPNPQRLMRKMQNSSNLFKHILIGKQSPGTRQEMRPPRRRFTIVDQ